MVWCNVLLDIETELNADLALESDTHSWIGDISVTQQEKEEPTRLFNLAAPFGTPEIYEGTIACLQTSSMATKNQVHSSVNLCTAK